MPRTELTEEWSIDVDDSFVSRIVDDDLQMVSPGPPMRSIWAATYSPPRKQGAKDLIALAREQAPPEALETFEEHGADAGELRFAAWNQETVEGRQQWALYACTARRGALVQTALLSDEEADLGWALLTWRSVTYTGDG